MICVSSISVAPRPSSLAWRRRRRVAAPRRSQRYSLQEHSRRHRQLLLGSIGVPRCRWRFSSRSTFVTTSTTAPSQAPRCKVATCGHGFVHVQPIPIPITSRFPSRIPTKVTSTEVASACSKTAASVGVDPAVVLQHGLFVPLHRFRHRPWVKRQVRCQRSTREFIREGGRLGVMVLVATVWVAQRVGGSSA